MEFNSPLSYMKLCTRCNIEKETSNFSKHSKRKDGLQLYCKNCYSDIDKQRYIERDFFKKEQYKQNTTNRRRINQQYVYNYLKSNPCIDCGEIDPIVLEFDHKEESDKIAAVSHMVSQYSLSKLKEEINKCEIRCANCHRRKTAIQLGWYKNIII